METLSKGKGNTLYNTIKEKTELDLRDNRGKRHCLSMIITSVLISIFRQRDGNLSSIHRSIVNMQQQLCKELNVPYTVAVSRSQLPLILQKIEYSVLAKLFFSFFKVELFSEDCRWFACDGKELRGSILDGDKRGDAIVQLISHENREAVAESYYSGKKESEIIAVRQLIQKGSSLGWKISLDALHLNPETTKLINDSGQVYLIGLKNNQEMLLTEATYLERVGKPNSTYKTEEKGHGRVDTRVYRSYDYSKQYIDERWEIANINTLIVVDRTSYNTKTEVITKERSFYLSNLKQTNQKGNELFDAVRNHWKIETNNYIRDVVLNEDALKTKEPAISKTLATFRTPIVNLLNRQKLKNIREKIESFVDNFQELIAFLTLNKVL